MTHPLSPREKVVAILDEHTTVGGTSAYRTGQVNSAELTGLILTALASGSGDHAELARLAEAATEMVAARDALTAHASTWKRLDKATIAYSNAINRLEPATVLALLAENAALRAAGEVIAQKAENAIQQGFSHIDRATEAGRKLAEAVRIFQQIETHHGVECIPDNEIQAEIRTFLSKEAERG